MKITVSIIALWLCVPALGQTSLADYRAAVADYSWQLKIAASKSDAAAETAGIVLFMVSPCGGSVFFVPFGA